MKSTYSTPLGLTSQFSFCGLPFRLDTYSGCAFSCSYCFARLRGGSAEMNKIRIADAQKIISKFKNAVDFPEQNTGLVSEYIRNRTPLHIGGMSDPFQPIEAKSKITYQVLKFLTEIQYPIIISTKSTIVARSEYLDILKANKNLVVQFSFSTARDDLAKIVEPQANPPSKLLRTIEKLSSGNINTTIRWQPYIPNFSEPFEEFISKVSSTGIRHLALEHLKLPYERNGLLWKKLSSNMNFDIIKHYFENGAIRDGREFILPAKFKIQNAKIVKNLCSKFQITFGCADNEIQYLSDNDCCCSGVDQFQGFENWNKFQIAHAIKKSFGKSIEFNIIEDEWFPKGAVDKYLNSNSRIYSPANEHNTVRDYVVKRWENLSSIFNPVAFYGIKYSGKRDENGMRIFEWNL